MHVQQEYVEDTKKRHVSCCIPMYPEYVFSRWIRIRQVVKGQGVDTSWDTYVGLRF